MGHKFTICIWKKYNQGNYYKYYVELETNSFFLAFWKMIQLRRKGAKCIKLEWR